MRPIIATVYQNLGRIQEAANSFSLADRQVSVGTISYSVDEHLTKVIPGDMTLKVADHDATFWAFIQNDIQVSTGLLPAFVTLDVDGEREFLGIVEPDKFSWDEGSRAVNFTAQDWSVMLANAPLEGDSWQRALPRAITSRSTPSPQSCISVVFRSQLKQFPQFRQMIAWPYPNTWGVSEGDIVSASDVDIDTTAPWTAGPWKLTNVGRVYTGANGDIPTNYMGAIPQGFNWDPYHGTDGTSCDATFSVEKLADLSDGYYKVATAFTPDTAKPKYEVFLDTIDGIVPGDVMTLVSYNPATWTVLSVDAERKSITTREIISSTLLVGDPVIFSEESRGQLVFEDALTILHRALLPYAIDTTRFKPAIFETPVFAWLALRGKGEDITAVMDVEPGLTDIRVLGNDSRSWDGTPETGWVRGSVTTRRACWTDQLVAPPSSLMPYNVPTIAPNTRFRYRKYDSFDSWNVNNGDGTYNPASTADIVVVVYDYILMRKIEITGTSCSIATWNGSSFNSPSTVSWPSANKVVSACVYPGLSGAVLGLTSAGTLELAFSGSLQSYTLPTLAAKGIVVTTPWAAYVVSATGYGRVMTSGGTLTLDWVDLTGEVTAFWPNTFVGIDGDNCFMMGRFDAVDETGTKRTETWGLFLAALPTTAEASVIDSERLLEGSPNLVGAFRDPSKLNRVIGQVAGQLFQVSRELPATIERFSPQGMSAIECVEHICQLHNAIAIPNAYGTMEIVSRMYVDDVYSLTVDRVTNTETRSFPNFYTVVRVSSFDDEDYYDAYGQDGGRLLEILQHPLVWGRSQCKAMAMSFSLWFGKPRKQRVEKWFHTDADSATPWDVLPRFPKVEVNASGEYFRVMKMDKDIVRGTATVTMVETDTAAYGMQYGRGRD